MDYLEFKNEFDLAYNNISSNQAPGLIEPEISVYLTKAQDIVEDALYAEFEKSEAARRKLAKLVITAKLNPVQIPEDSIIYPQYTSTFKPLSDVRYIVNEQVKISDTKTDNYGKRADQCVRGKFLKVQPILHDEIDTIVENPFRFNVRRALRLDASYNNNNYIEILTKNKDFVDYYQIRYVKNADPIIIYTSSEYPDTINGVNPPAILTQGVDLGSLPKETHRQIVEIAAKLAYQDYKS